MIVWINGAFGSGKTTTAGLLVERLDGAKLFDPEYVGYMLKMYVDTPTGDFQDLPLWRHLVVETVVGLAEYPHLWVAPMSLIDPGYRGEILGGIRDAGVDLHEFILDVPEEPLRARIDADEVDRSARGWRQDHVTQAVTSFAALTDAELTEVTLVDATRAPGEVADHIAAAVRRTQSRNQRWAPSAS